MRVFVAIELDKKTKSAVKSVADSLALFGKGSFCRKESYHITLAFLGEVDSIVPIVAAMEAVEFPRFSLELSELGCFGNTYYVGIDNSASLNLLWRSLADELKARGFKPENRRFLPHITLARRFVASGTPFVFVPSADFAVEGISLMETAGPGIYKRLYFKGAVK